MAGAFKIKEVDPFNPKIQAEIKRLHKLTFGNTATLTKKDIQKGYAWLVYTRENEAVAFALACPAVTTPFGFYLSRVGVLEPYRGQGLQRRLITVRERKAKSLGKTVSITDTTFNVPSANSLIRSGYLLYKPDFPWAFPETLYWRKTL